VVIVGGQSTAVYERTDYNDSVTFNLDNPNSYFTRNWKQYPQDMKREVPNDVPEKIGNAYEEALDNLHRGKYETSVLLCGKALDLSTKGMDAAWKLDQRLKKLAADGKITAAMADWAQEIRVDRNAAIHEDEDFTQKDAEDIVTFTEAFLTYIYTLPALINSRREKPEEE
jgi:HEPN domain-containing protein